MTGEKTGIIKAEVVQGKIVSVRSKTIPQEFTTFTAILDRHNEEVN